MYLEEYFEEQLKEFYPDRIFPGGREEQMIPPLEDEIEEDEECEMATEGAAQGAVQAVAKGVAESVAPTEEQKTQSPAMGEGLPPVEEVEAAGVTAGDREGETEKEITTIDRGTDIVVKSEGDAPPTATTEEYEMVPEEVALDSVLSPSEEKDVEELSKAKEENFPLPKDLPVVLPEAQQETEDKAEAEEPVAEEAAAMEEA